MFARLMARLRPPVPLPGAWQSMASAPTNGTVVLGYGRVNGAPGACIVLMHFYNMGTWEVLSFNGQKRMPVEPTYWMHRPPSPEPDIQGYHDAVERQRAAE